MRRFHGLPALRGVAQIQQEFEEFALLRFHGFEDRACDGLHDLPAVPRALDEEVLPSLPSLPVFEEQVEVADVPAPVRQRVDEDQEKGAATRVSRRGVRSC